MKTIICSLSDVLPEGYRLRDYIINRVLGQGGFGIAYLATEVLTGHQVVIKENYPTKYVLRCADYSVVCRNPAAKKIFRKTHESFVKEARTLRSLPHHDNIMGVHAVFDENGTAYMVLPYVEGKCLEKLSPQYTSMPESQLLPLLQKLLVALSHLHEHGVAHRDIKPENIMMKSDGEPVLVDFGAARFMDSEQGATRICTSGYAPPEQVSKDDYDGYPQPYTDLYALGATCYRLITGQHPNYSSCRMADNTELLGRYSKQLLGTIDRAREFEPAARWQSAQEWLAALQPQAKLPSHRKCLIGGAVSIVAAIAAATALYLVLPGEMSSQVEEARQRLKAGADAGVVELLREPAEQGDARAQALLGMCYQLGRGTPVDINEATKWYRRAAEQGETGAQTALGFLYCPESNSELSYDLVEAVKWFRKAAEGGNATAQYYLGYCYEHGRGALPVDNKKAADWYTKAAEQGNERAREALNGLSG